MPSTRALIDAHRLPDGSIHDDVVRTVLPYGDAFLFVDRITRLTTDEVEASFRIPEDSPYVLAHFRHLHLMPGVLTGEGMVQAGAFLIRYRLDLGSDVDIVVTQVDKAEFPAPARPGETLRYRVALRQVATYAIRLDAQAHVGERRVCAARLCVMPVERHQLEELLARA